MSYEKEVSVNGSDRKQPDHRHLRRVAEAIAGRDEDRDLWAIVRLNGDMPFECHVFGTQAEAERALQGVDGHWALIPCRSEPAESSSHSFFVVMHDPTSPTRTERTKIDRRNIRRFRLMVEHEGADGKIQTDMVDLSSNIGTTQWPSNPQIDAVFFTIEAMDKYLFPNLVNTYGTRGANTLRARAIRQLKDQGVDFRPEINASIMDLPPSPAASQ